MKWVLCWAFFMVPVGLSYFRIAGSINRTLTLVQDSPQKTVWWSWTMDEPGPRLGLLWCRWLFLEW